MAISITYSYKVEANFVLDGKEEPILPECITSIVTNFDYDNNNIPIIYLGVRLKTALYNTMISNSEKGTITLIISKCKNGNLLYQNYIRDTFVYSMATNPEYNESLEKQTDSYDKIGTNYVEGHIALMNLEMINNNKRNTNGIIKDSNMTSIIHKFTSHMQMVMEPLFTDNVFKHLIIKPVESISKLLKYLNQVSPFYDGGYRFFIDFDRAYLLSTNGNPIDAKDGNYSTVIINVTDPVDKEAHQTGVITDHENEAYILNINANNTVTDVKKADDKVFNKIVAVDSQGNKKEVDLDIPKAEGVSEKVRLERVPYDNMDYAEHLKNNIETSVINFSVTKTEVDSSLITPNKEFLVRNYPRFSEYNGNYVLSYKKETFINQDNTFISSVIFGLRKVKDR